MKRPCRHCRQLIEAAESESHRHRCYTAHRTDGRPQHTSGAGWKRTRAQIKARDGYQCTAVENGVRCPETTGLEVAHLDRNWRNDDPSRLATLCPRHHRRYDSQPEVF